MIPKIIHYCWFGGNPLPENVKKYIATWKSYLPDYEIKQWNELNFNVHCCKYVEEAYVQKKWAFVSDVARVYALCQEGGIYIDTDVEVVRSFDSLLNNRMFLGFEGTEWVGTNIFASEAHHPILEEFYSRYLMRTFVKPDGSLDLTTNVKELTEFLTNNYNLILNGKEQELSLFHIYPTDYFSPYDYIQDKLHKTKNTYSIHWYAKSWVHESSLRKRLSILYHRLLGIRMK